MASRFSEMLTRSFVPKAGLGNLLIGPRTSGGGRNGPTVATKNVNWQSPGQPQILDMDAQAFGEDSYLNQVYVMRCVQLIANTIAGLEFRAGMDPTNPATHDPTAPLVQLLGRSTPQAPGGPNPDTASRAFWAWTICQYIVYGKFAWEAQLTGKQIVALWPLVSACVSAVPSNGGQRYFDSYVYTTPMDGDLPMKADRMIYAWRPSLTDWRVPETVLSAAKLPIYIAKGMDRYMVKLLENDMVATTIVTTPPFEEPSARRAWQEQFDTMFSGVDAKGRTIFAEADYDEDDTSGKPLIQVEKIAQTAVEAELLTISNQAKTDITIALGVSISLIGDASKRIYANADSEYRCLRASEYVRLANGERHQAKDMVGKVFTMLTSTPGGTKEVEAAASWQAIEPCYAVTTESGRRLEVTAKHPLYKGVHQTAKEYRRRQGRKPGHPVTGTGDSAERRAIRETVHVDIHGWTAIKDLEIGDLVAVPTELPMTGHGSMTKAEATVLGAITGDGCVRTTASPVLTTPDGPEVDTFKAAVHEMGDEVTKYTTLPPRCDTWGIKGGKVRKFLEQEGLWGLKGHDKLVTPGVFAAAPEVQVAYLQALFAADGCASTTDTRAFITLVSVSHQLVLDVQELLIRFGISARIVRRNPQATGFDRDKTGKKFGSYALSIDIAEEVLKFCDRIGIPAKQRAVDAARQIAESRGRNNSGWRTQQLNPGLRWERIKTIEYVGVDQTVGIEIPDGHTYLGTFWEHNTFWTLTIMNLLTEIQDHVNQRLAPRIGPEVGWFDLSKVASLQPPSIFQPPMIGDVINFGVATAAQVANVLGIPAANSTGEEDTDTVEIGEESSATGAGGMSGGGGGRSASWRGTRVTKDQLIAARIRWEQRPLNSFNWEDRFRASDWLEREHIDVYPRSVIEARSTEVTHRSRENQEALAILRKVNRAKERHDMAQLENRRQRSAELVERTTQMAQDYRALAVADQTTKHVHDTLAQNYPESTLDWVDDADWSGPQQIPLDQIDMARRPGARDPKKVAGIAQGIAKGDTGALAPVMLVKTPGSVKLKVADGYHRTKAHEKLGHTTVAAYVGSVDEDEGPWDSDMHDAKLNRMLNSMEVRRGGLKVAQNCKYGSHPATKAIVWAEGAAYVPVCADHYNQAVTKIGGPTEVDKVVDLPQAERQDTGQIHGPDRENVVWVGLDGKLQDSLDEDDEEKMQQHLASQGAVREDDDLTEAELEVVAKLLHDDVDVMPYSGTDFHHWFKQNEMGLLALAEAEA
jgi:phage portal protein BeeE